VSIQRCKQTPTRSASIPVKRIAERRLTNATVPVEFGGLTGERLDLPSGEFDALLSTWTLCTIPNLDAALAEIRRVLKPDGSFHFIEHGHSPDERVARLQHRFEPMNKRLGGGCHLTRHIFEDIEKAAFDIEKIETYYFKREPKPIPHPSRQLTLTRVGAQRTSNYCGVQT
jgi:ubiquinone/menaquinone biosynthesis C-methylase UbiE